jgi:hypothetical protein
MRFRGAGWGASAVDELPSVPAALDWFVAFTPARPRWYTLLCRPGFRHCLAFRFDREHGTWLWAELHLTGFRLDPLHGYELDARLAVLRAGGATILRYRVPAGAEGRAPRLLYCVPFVSHLLGLRGSALSPYGLYRRLLRAGAVPAFEQRQQDGQGVQQPQAAGP